VTRARTVEPLAVEHVRSSFFEQFPPGTVASDCALLMRRVPHAWHARAPLAG
jgi:hypothetical protein